MIYFNTAQSSIPKMSWHKCHNCRKHVGASMQAHSDPYSSQVEDQNECKPYGRQSDGGRRLSLSKRIRVRNWLRHAVLKKISESDSHLVESGKRRLTFKWRKVSAPGGAGKGQVSPSPQWLPPSWTRKLSPTLQKNSLSLLHSISLYLSAYLPPLSPFILFCMQCLPTPSSKPPPPFLSLSAAVKSDRSQVCFHFERRLHGCWVPATTQRGVASPPIYCAVIYPQTSNILKQQLYTQGL